MNIGLIGCGRAGVSIFNLMKIKQRITGVYDINAKRQKYASRLLGARSFPLAELGKTCDVLFIATPDDMIELVYKKLKPLLTGTKYLFHFSGILSSAVISGSRSLYCASAHPFSTFPKIITKRPAEPYYLFCEGDPRALNMLRAIMPARYFRMIKIKPEEKVFHHLSGVFASNLLVGLFLAARTCTKKNWPKKLQNELIARIMDQTLRNISKLGAGKALSGPLKRGDHRVILKHLTALKAIKDIDQAYRALSKILLKALPENSKNRRIKKLLEQ